MLRVIIATSLLVCVPVSSFAQTEPAATTRPTATPAAKKPATKSKTAAKRGPAESGPCQIGVIPAIGDVFVVQRVGITVFGNEYAEASTQGWGLDDLVVARIRAAAPGVAVRKIGPAKDAFAAMERPKGLSGLFDDAKAEMVAAVRQSAGSTRCDRYILVERARSQFSNLNQSVRGIGIVGWAYRSYLFALTHVWVFGEDFSIIKHGAASTEDEPPMSRVLLLNPIRGPNQQLDGGHFPATPDEAASDPAFRDRVRALLAASLDQTVPAMLAKQP